MTDVSASPARLATFAEVWRARAAAVDEQASLSGLAKSVVAGCPGRAVEVPALGALTTVLENMATNEAFVATVRDAVMGADAIAGGIATMDVPSSTPRSTAPASPTVRRCRSSSTR